MILSDTEQRVYCALIEHPDQADSSIGEKLGISRHTVSRIRKKFLVDELIKEIRLPDHQKLGFEILAFYHIKFDPSNPPDLEKDEIFPLLSDSTVFMASRKFEAILISIYANYDEYRMDMTEKIQLLKEKKWIVESPIIKMYGLNKLIVIKDFNFFPITKKVLGIEQ
jgi:DNA-binding Lrp family transcriptional regulator